MRSKPCLTLDDVFKMVEACRKAGAKVNEEPTVAIVDAGGALMYLERPDHNSANTVHMATGKARTAELGDGSAGEGAARISDRAGRAGGARRRADLLSRRMRRWGRDLRQWP